MIFECNIHPQNINLKKETFLYDVIKSWFEIKKTKQENTSTSSEILWNNQHIKVLNKTLFYENWLNNGIKYIKHIYNYEQNRFYSFINLVDMYNVPNTDFLNYMSLVTSISTAWKTNLQNESCPNEIELRDNLLFKLKRSKQKTRFIYSYQLNNEPQVQVPSKAKWENEFLDQQIEWEIVYIQAIKTTLDVKIKNFQYKYLQRIIPTNKLLFKQNISPSNLCGFCSMNIEDLRHLFWGCCHVQTFWNNMKILLSNLNIHFEISYNSISFGVTGYGRENKMYNFILFHAKYFIFLNKCKHTIPNIGHLKRYLKIKLNIEKEISLSHDQLQLFESRWGLFYRQL